MNRDQALTAAFINRLALGTMFVSHGLLKVFVFTLPGAATPGSATASRHPEGSPEHAP